MLLHLLLLSVPRRCQKAKCPLSQRLPWCVCVDTNTEAVDGAVGDDAELAVPTFRVDSANRWYRDDREIGRLQGPFGTHGTYKVGGTFGHQQSGCGGNLGAILRWGWVSPPSARVVTKGLPRGAVHGIARSTGRHREF